MNPCARIVVLAASSLSLLLAGSASADVILHANFEPPTYTLGYIDGQDGWTAGIGWPHQVTNTIVHGGTQSLNGVRDTRNFDAEFSSLGNTWFAEAWCYTQPMPGSYASHFSIGNGLNEHFWIELRGDGQLTFYSFSTIEVRTLGTVALNKWLRFRAELISFPSTIRMSVIGDGVNESWDYDMIAAGAPSFVHVGVYPPGNFADGEGSFWDDIVVANEGPVSTESTSWGAIRGLYR